MPFAPRASGGARCRLRPVRTARDKQRVPPAAWLAVSEDHLRRELYQSCSARPPRGSRIVEAGAADECVVQAQSWIYGEQVCGSELRMVEHVEELRPELESALTAKQEILGHHEIRVADARRTQAVPASSGIGTGLSLDITCARVLRQVRHYPAGGIRNRRYCRAGIAAGVGVKHRPLH